MRHYNLDAAPLQCPHRTAQEQQQPQREGENKLIFYLARRDSPHAMPRPQKEQDVEDAPPPPHAFCLPFYGHHQKRIKILLRQRERSTPSPSTPLAKVCPGVLNIKSTTTTMGRESGGEGGSASLQRVDSCNVQRSKQFKRLSRQVRQRTEFSILFSTLNMPRPPPPPSSTQFHFIVGNSDKNAAS